MSSDIVALIDRLSDALASGQAQSEAVAEAIGGTLSDDGATLSVNGALGGRVELVPVPSGGAVWSAIVSLAGNGVPLADLESAYGAGSPLPKSRPGAASRVRWHRPEQSVTLIGETGPGDLVTGVTVQSDLAEL